MKTYTTCRICKAVYFNKAWHHGDEVGVSTIKKNNFMWTTRCPACKMVESRRYEGLIRIAGIPDRSTDDLLKLVVKFTNRAYRKNCQHRLIAVVKEDKHSWTVTTTDNNLATRLAQKIGEAFDHVDVSTIYSSEPQSKIKLFVEFLPLFYHRLNPQRG